MSIAGGMASLPAKGGSCGRPTAGAASTGDNRVRNRRRINENNEEVLHNGHNPESLSTTGRLEAPVNRQEPTARRPLGGAAESQAAA